MRSAIIDTNVIVSAVLGSGYPRRIMYELFLFGKFEMHVSNELLREYEDVLARPKFIRYPEFEVAATLLMERIRQCSCRFAPKESVHVIRDDADNRLLELALVSKADFIVTGNFNDFNFNLFHDTRIVGPKEFHDLFEKN
jgi:putative PIN family toxin of toxin-antitoxin system